LPNQFLPSLFLSHDETPGKSQDADARLKCFRAGADDAEAFFSHTSNDHVFTAGVKDRQAAAFAFPLRKFGYGLLVVVENREHSFVIDEGHPGSGFSIADKRYASAVGGLPDQSNPLPVA
jgi:hypothetical protein